MTSVEKDLRKRRKKWISIFWSGFVVVTIVFLVTIVLMASLSPT